MTEPMIAPFLFAAAGFFHVGGFVRSTMIVGIVLLLLGGFLMVRGGTFTTQKDIIKVGDVKVTAPDDHNLPSWVGPAVVVAGLGVLVFGGVSSRKA